MQTGRVPDSQLQNRQRISYMVEAVRCLNNDGEFGRTIDRNDPVETIGKWASSDASSRIPKRETLARKMGQLVFSGLEEQLDVDESDVVATCIVHQVTDSLPFDTCVCRGFSEAKMHTKLMYVDKEV